MKQKVFIAGHNGMVGSAIVRQLEGKDDIELILANRNELDLLDFKAVNQFFSSKKIDQVYLAAAKVGGINANNIYPAEFIHQNLVIENNIIHASHINNIQKLLFLGSSCIYPKMSVQPIPEDALLTGILESTNEPYAIAKIAGIKLCESYNRQYGRDYRSVMPTNLYGQNDNFHLENSHVLPALLMKFHHAKINNSPSVVIWGTGKPKREFLHVDDMANACIFVMNLASEEYNLKTRPMLSHLNVGCGIDISIKALAELISDIVGYKGKLVFDDSKPDGTPRKVLNVSKLNSLGWHSSIDLKTGIKNTYHWFLENKDRLRS